MKIGLLTRYLCLGTDWDSGIGQHFRILADGLVGDGHEVTIFLLCDPKKVQAIRSDYEVLNPKWKLEIIKCGNWLTSVLSRRHWALAQLIDHLKGAMHAWMYFILHRCCRKLDVVETHSFYIPHFFATFLGVGLPLICRVSTLQMQIVSDSPLTSRLLRFESWMEILCLRSCRQIVTHSEQHLKCLQEFVPETIKKVHLVAHAVVGPEDLPVAIDRPGVVTILFVGRFEHRKGIDLLLEAIPDVLRQLGNVRFVLAGDSDGLLWKRFVSTLSEGERQRVEYRGRVSPSELHELYSECNIFVGPSRYESFGLMFAEALSYGVPCIGFRVGGVPDVVTSGTTGILVDNERVDLLSHAIVSLVRNNELRKSMSTQARQDYLLRFSPKTLVKNSIKMYQEVVESSGL